jgi:hypothetical protein
MARRSFSARISVPVRAGGALHDEKDRRGAISVRQGRDRTLFEVEAGDMASFRALVNSLLRDLSVIDSVSKLAKLPKAGQPGKSI